jgi:hypothetical protein
MRLGRVGMAVSSMARSWHSVAEHPCGPSGWCQTKTALLPAPFWCTYAGTGPLRLALAGATRSGSAGVGSLGSRSADKATPHPSGSIGTTIDFRAAAIAHRDIAASALLIASRLALTAAENIPPASGPTGLRGPRRSPQPGCPKPGQLTKDERVRKCLERPSSRCV